MSLRPASCQGCLQPVAVYYTLVAGGVAQTHALCKVCPTLQAETRDGFLPSLALGITLSVPSPVGRGKCPTCGFRWADFERIHRLGCATCYETHSEQVTATIARIQPGLTHQGRSPVDPIADRQARLCKAKERLKSAQMEEDFETAAILRDQIAALEAEQPATRK